MIVVLSALLVVCLVICNLRVRLHREYQRELADERDTFRNNLRLSKAECVGLSDQVAQLTDEKDRLIAASNAACVARDELTRERDKALGLVEELRGTCDQLRHKADVLELQSERDLVECRRLNRAAAAAKATLEELKRRVRDMAEIECGAPERPKTFGEMATEVALQRSAAAPEPSDPHALASPCSPSQPEAPKGTPS